MYFQFKRQVLQPWELWNYKILCVVKYGISSVIVKYLLSFRKMPYLWSINLYWSTYVMYILFWDLKIKYNIFKLKKSLNCLKIIWLETDYVFITTLEFGVFCSSKSNITKPIITNENLLGIFFIYLFIYSPKSSINTKMLS